MNLFRKYHAFNNKVFQIGYMQYALIKYGLVLVIYAFFIEYIIWYVCAFSICIVYKQTFLLSLIIKNILDPAPL